VPADPQLLQRLRSRIAAIEHGGSGIPHGDECLPLGVPEIDAHLPWGGLAAGAVHEILDGDAPTSNSTTKIGGALNGAVTAFAAAIAGKPARVQSSGSRRAPAPAKASTRRGSPGSASTPST
jgi:hypothetical protein